MLDYKGKLVLAPMVRVSELPLRKLCLLNGADLVWGPEVIDKGLVASNRQVNDKLKTIDFIQNGTNKLVWRTKPSLEKSKVIFQLGSADPELAVQAAEKVAQDVAGIDLNCGCPKHFSIHSGSGAQLLRTPDLLCSILVNLVEKVGKPFNIAISAKIRVLENAAKTYELVSRIVKTGISCLTVHCRTTPMRPREPAFYDYLKEIASICKANNVACLVNGDIRNREMMHKFMEEYGVDGAMIAREAQVNPLTCFSHDPPVEPEEPLGRKEEDAKALVSCRAFVDACIEYDYNKAHTKYNLTTFVSGKSPLYAQFARSKSIEEMHNIIEQSQKSLSEELNAEDNNSAAEKDPASSTKGNTQKGTEPDSKSDSHNDSTNDSKKPAPERTEAQSNGHAQKRKLDSHAETAPPSKRV